MRIAAKGLIALMMAGAPINENARAQDASFGCKVLLCAAASAPGWSAIPYCVPVMQELFRQLAHGGAWPVCAEGHAGGFSYEPYLPCPSGMSPMPASGGDSLALVASANGNLCATASGDVVRLLWREFCAILSGERAGDSPRAALRTELRRHYDGP